MLNTAHKLESTLGLEPTTEEQKLVLQVAEEVVVPLWQALKHGKRGVNPRALVRHGLGLFRALERLLESSEPVSEALSQQQRDALEVIRVLASRPNYNGSVPRRVLDQFDQRTINALLRKGVLKKVDDDEYVLSGPMAS